MDQWSLDRFEGETAVCYDDLKQEFKIKKNMLPCNVKEGDVVTLSNGSYVIDIDATQKRKELARSLFSSLLDSNQDN